MMQAWIGHHCARRMAHRLSSDFIMQVESETG